MQFYSRKIIKPQDLNNNGTLFGGAVLSWIDEEAAQDSPSVEILYPPSTPKDG